jgi:hypothetical protein
MTVKSTHGPAQHRAHVRRRAVAIAALAAIAVAVVALTFGSEDSTTVAPEPALVSGATDTANTDTSNADRAAADTVNTDRAAAENPAPQEPPKILTIGWVGDVTPGSQYGLPARDGRALFASVLEPLRAPDLMIANLEGTFSVGGSSKCGAGSSNCYAFQAPPRNAGALRHAGIDLVNLANNHSYDFGAGGARQTTAALRKAKVEYAGLPDQVTVVSSQGARIAVVGFATYKWAPSLNDPAVVDELVGRAKKAAPIVVVLFHGGAEGSDRTHVPSGSEFAFGENRGNLRRFARAAIDAGADVVLGSGPHVIRGMEVYRKRLIAYSLGNFAGVGNFATGGTLSLSALLTMRLDPDGRLRDGGWRSLTLGSSGIPRPDPTRASRALARQLSIADFGARAARISPSGRVVAP